MERGAVSSSEAVESTSSEREAPSEPPEPSTDALEVRGRLIVLDARDIELTPMDARMRMVAWRGASGEPLDVEVQRGNWTARVASGRSVQALSVDRIVAGELRLALETPKGQFPVSSSREIEIRARVPRPSSLRVVDVLSGADLADVTLVRLAPFPLENATHPGASYEERVVARHQRSPIALDAWRDVLREGVLVGSEGYAWERVKVDLERGGERRVALQRGAQLDIVVNGVDPSVHAVMRLRTASDPSPICEERLTTDTTFALRGLAPAAYTIQAEIGEWYRDRVKLGTATIELSAGEAATVTLSVGAAPKIERASAGGVAYLPTEWKRERLRLVMKSLEVALDGAPDHFVLDTSSTPSERAGYDAFRWLRNDLQIGRYELGSFDPPFSVVIVVPPEGLTDFAFVIPPPADLRVSVLDDATAEPVVVQLMWNPRRPDGVSGGGLDNAEYDATDRVYLIRAPVCEIELSIRSWEFAPYEGSIDLSHGQRELTIRTQRSCGFTLKLRDEEAFVAFPQDWYGSLEAVTGAGVQTLSQVGSLERKFMVSEPGRYRIELPKLSGYAQPPAPTIEVLAGRFTEHIVALERERP